MDELGAPSPAEAPILIAFYALSSLPVLPLFYAVGGLPLVLALSLALLVPALLSRFLDSKSLGEEVRGQDRAGSEDYAESRYREIPFTP